MKELSVWAWATPYPGPNHWRAGNCPREETLGHGHDAVLGVFLLERGEVARRRTIENFSEFVEP